jgi:hypothetical protein
MTFIPLETEIFSYQHLLDSDENLKLIKSFSVKEESGKGLENYLKNVSEIDERNDLARTYLVKDKRTKELAAYFSLRSGLFTIEISEDYFYTIPSIELSNFAVNDNYRINHPEILEIGKTVFLHFILPYVDFMKSIVGVKALYIYALPEDRLIEHYKKFGFQRLSKDEEKFVHSHVKPKYDKGCIFMYQLV